MIKKKYNIDEVFWTADDHFFHSAIIDYCSRPFSCVEEMNEVLITNWNKVVDKDKTVVINGDFAFTGNLEVIKGLLDRLNGNKVLVQGNHCKKNKFNRDSVKALFNGDVYDQLEIIIKDDNTYNGSQLIFNSHYPNVIWPSSHNGSFHCFGHVHTRPNNTASDADLMKRYYDLGLKSYDVGVDNNNFTPISYLDLRKKIINF